jgi:hypothetical protein
MRAGAVLAKAKKSDWYWAKFILQKEYFIVSSIVVN